MGRISQKTDFGIPKAYSHEEAKSSIYDPKGLKLVGKTIFPGLCPLLCILWLRFFLHGNPSLFYQTVKLP
jgi:hypothetical protein